MDGLLYDAWVQAERQEPHVVHAVSARKVKSKLVETGLAQNVPQKTWDNIMAQRKAELEASTVAGPLRIFPEDQWLAYLSGPGLDGPSGAAHRLLAYSQETIEAVHQSLSWHSLPVEDRIPESYFTFGEGQVLVPRMSTHQPQTVSNPFRPHTHLPFHPPPPFIPKANIPGATLPHSASQNPLATTNPQVSVPKLPDRPHTIGPPRAATITSSAPTQSHAHHSSSSGAYPGTHSTTHGHNNGRSQSQSQPHLHTTQGPPQLPSRAPISHSASTSPSSSATATTKPTSSTSLTATTSASSGRRLSDSKRTRSHKDGEYSDHVSTQTEGTIDGVDASGPPRCPDEMAGYCRSWNIVHQPICKYTHIYWSENNDPTGFSSKYKFSMTKLSPGSPEFDYIKIRFINSWIHQSSKRPSVTKIKQVSCPLLEKLFNQRQEAIAATGVKPNITELYHGTCEANFATLFTQGFQPPADYAPHPQCPVSGPYADKLQTSLCKRTCRLCTSMPRHKWNMCHMWGFGIYCAIDSSKSDIYVSNKKGKKTDRTKRKMLLCSVILGEAETVKQLKRPDEMHERVMPAPGKNSIFAVGFKQQVIPTLNGQTLGVMNDEYVVFHPHQIMPLYVIEYSK